jgi:guanylate kinase
MKTPLIIVSAPSGAGKSSFCKRAIEDFASELMYSVSYTTRAPRGGESEGEPYHFVTREAFIELKNKNFFVETAEVYGNLYGTPRNQVDEARKQKKILIMDVDVQGAESFRAEYPEATFIFILPPSIDELRRRLLLRDKGKTPNMDVRLKKAAEEMAQSSHFQHRIINDDFEVSYSQFKKIIEELVKHR